MRSRRLSEHSAPTRGAQAGGVETLRRSVPMEMDLRSNRRRLELAETRKDDPDFGSQASGT
jgi:hypothetical protein